MEAAKIKLNDFWVDSPAAWFGMAEAQFHLRGITGELDRFCIVVAAVNGRQKQHQQPKKDKQQGLKKPLSPAETAAAKAARKSRPTNVAQAASGLCHYHWTWGADAHKCEAPCTWQGN
jgi:hypothetical protein